MHSNSEKKKLLKENDYQVGSGTNLTCAKISPKCLKLAMENISDHFLSLLNSV